MGYSFSTDPDFTFRTQVAIGGIPHGLGDAGEILAAVERIPAGDNHAWAAQFTGLADRVAGIATGCQGRGQHRSARDAFLRASTYYSFALEALQYFTDDNAIRSAFHSHRQCWEAFADLNEPHLERITIPYKDTEMPGYFLSVDGTKRPTLILINGSDGAVTWLWPEMQAAFDRGYNALIFDGPGQQSMLFDRGIPFRPDWEHVITPVVDALLARTDVDADALVLFGGSQGGYWAPRAMAFEHRIAAGVFDPGVMDISTSWLSHFPAELVQLLDSGDQKSFDAAMGPALAAPPLAQTWTFRARPYGVSSPFSLFRAMRSYVLSDVASQITAPVMICDPENESFWPGQAQQLADAVGGPAHLVTFTAAEGADMHCEPMARSLVHQRMYDWLADTLPGAG